ncbi:hypothetical protein BDY17DRAFT_308565 [Neohortaea acidophila]|uniref:Uncharacterized protein n=1 Tax=Neohortaea acidophila TaxID=245834 RepID=A0A6A6PYP2_9PEZI|nr:uncharacterized protein BDY17DRAFT_308565 [Neohortaea acidophila]KAF2485112.1 hypothetical protein BDY17DRAFT_308565 [Neohortaea acidophila]
MPSRTSPAHSRERSLSWPSPSNRKANPPQPVDTDYTTSAITNDPFLDDLEDNPDQHFLAPIQMYEYEAWPGDSDDEDTDDGCVEWAAGITDFALFDDDRRRARQQSEPLPRKWSAMLQQQTSALQRSLNRGRVRSSKEADSGERVLDVEEMPSLTPDTSPRLRDDLETAARDEGAKIPEYLMSGANRLREEQGMDGMSTNGRDRQQTERIRRQQRPGLGHSRTMSGRAHAWTRPSSEIYTVGEEPENESERSSRRSRSSGRGDSNGDDDEMIRGRARSQR